MTNAEFFNMYERTSETAFKAAYLLLGDTEAACEAMSRAYYAVSCADESAFYRQLCRIACRTALLRRITGAPVEKDSALLAMSALSICERKIIVMRRILGMSCPEIASELRMPAPVFSLVSKNAYRKLSMYGVRTVTS